MGKGRKEGDNKIFRKIGVFFLLGFVFCLIRLYRFLVRFGYKGRGSCGVRRAVWFMCIGVRGKVVVLVLFIEAVWIYGMGLSLVFCEDYYNYIYMIRIW